MEPIVIIGAGGYAQELVWILDDINSNRTQWECLGYIDPDRPDRAGQILYDRPVLGGWDAVTRLPSNVWFGCGIGDPTSRAKECVAAEALGWRPATLVHPSVVAARHVEIGAGTIVGAGSILAPYARVGRHCAINLAVTVGHNSIVGDYSVLSPGSRVSGGAVLEERVFLGTNSTVYLNRRVGAGASLGANSFLLTNLAAGKTAIGIPAVSFGAATGAGTCTAIEAKAHQPRIEEGL